MSKLSYDELQQRLAEARAQIAPGSRWQHYKGGQYIVVDIAFIELTNELAVVYRSLEHPAVMWIRPLVVWQEMVEYEGVKVFRFHPAG